MSVRKNDRDEQKLHVLEDAKNLTKYTLQKVKTESIFPKKHRWTLANRIINECLDAMTCINMANGLTLDDYCYAERFKQQRMAYGHLQNLLTLITLSKDECPGLTWKQVEHWTKLVDTTEKTLQAWIKSDKERRKRKNIG